MVVETERSRQAAETRRVRAFARDDENEVVEFALESPRDFEQEVDVLLDREAAHREQQQLCLAEAMCAAKARGISAREFLEADSGWNNGR